MLRYALRATQHERQRSPSYLPRKRGRKENSLTRTLSQRARESEKNADQEIGVPDEEKNAGGAPAATG